MIKNKIFLSPPHIGGAELKYINQAFDTNWISTVGPQIDSFEKSLAQFCTVSNVVALSSG